MDDDFAQLWQDGFETVPYPSDQTFAGRVLKTRDVIEVVMIQLIVNRLECGLDIAEIHDPAGIGAWLAGNA